MPLPFSLALKEIPLVDMDIKEMLAKGAIHAVPLDQLPGGGGGLSATSFWSPKRRWSGPVINFKILNHSLRYNHFKMEETEINEFPVIGILFYAQRILGSPGGKHCKWLESTTWHPV